MVSVLAFNSDDLSLNPNEVYSFFSEKCCLKRTKINVRLGAFGTKMKQRAFQLPLEGSAWKVNNNTPLLLQIAKFRSFQSNVAYFPFMQCPLAANWKACWSIINYFKRNPTDQRVNELRKVWLPRRNYFGWCRQQRELNCMNGNLVTETLVWFCRRRRIGGKIMFALCLLHGGGGN